MQHTVYRILEARVTGPQSLWHRFDGGATREVDLAPVLFGVLYGRCATRSSFRAWS